MKLGQYGITAPPTIHNGPKQKETWGVLQRHILETIPYSTHQVSFRTRRRLGAGNIFSFEVWIPGNPYVQRKSMPDCRFVVKGLLLLWQCSCNLCSMSTFAEGLTLLAAYNRFCLLHEVNHLPARPAKQGDQLLSTKLDICSQSCHSFQLLPPLLPCTLQPFSSPQLSQFHLLRGQDVRTMVAVGACNAVRTLTRRGVEGARLTLASHMHGGSN
mmetsp:Transcript_59421/g.109956  ORF Transcript_59421/g.109956 Transcript_59421/m.109956 type:complete len:214 (+) Transcript_59421:80-721(+)